ncbi:hypothetical protein H310_10154 [Aphanomyces invadans]|uniref:PH domain-containing protein n=1 Tax=Aphanomyces invadans TaxID=157072 RepID=A0A024TTC5_9STRA|nr:hypothetical protein H310_10154 [Aphanomyces invadans]ETV96876.1 hypothetical protein H310_10154 [Aphanomyces invadans]|eukprot:XP_008874653.1 hypothetical protein H310_10154 [Aphanomyces invadans]
MKSLVQRLSPRKGSSSKTLTGGFPAFHAHIAETDDGDVGVELMSDRVVVQKNGMPTPMRELLFIEIRNIEWNYHSGTVTFHDVADGVLVVTMSPALSQFEESLTTALNEAQLPQLPGTTYVGVFSGSKQPRILQQLRSSLVRPERRTKIPLALRRELLLADRPPPSSVVVPSRDAVCLEFLRHGTMTFLDAATPSNSLIVTETHLVLVQDEPAKMERIAPYDSIESIHPNMLRSAVELRFVDASAPPVLFPTTEPALVCQAVWFFLNQLSDKTAASANVVPASLYGRPVYSSAAVTSPVPSSTCRHDSGGPSSARWVKHQGPLSKTASEGFHLTQSWKKKHAILHDSPLGAWLSYADTAEKTEPSSKRIDLASVLCIRPQAALPDAPPFSFDIVTLYRTWSFCAADEADRAAWLRVLGEHVDLAAALVPDAPLSCEVKLATQQPLDDAATTRGPTPLTSATLAIASDGIRLTTAPSSDVSTIEWYFTDIHKWSLALQPQPSLCLSCFMDASCSKVGEFVLQTKNAAAMCQAIEFHVAKCLAKVDVLHEARAVKVGQTPPGPAKDDSIAPATPPPPTTTKIDVVLGLPPYQRVFHAVQPIVLPPLPPIQSFRRVSVM